MDAKTCLQKLQYVGVLAFATTDAGGNPQVRNISAIHYEPDAMYFFTARGKDFCQELLADGRVQILGYTRFKEMIGSQPEPCLWQRINKTLDGCDLSGAALSFQCLSGNYPGDRHCICDPPGLYYAGQPYKMPRSIASTAGIAGNIVLYLR